MTETTLFRIAAYAEAGGYSERLNLRVLVEGGVTWTDEPDDVRAVFVGTGRKPLYPAWRKIPE